MAVALLTCAPVLGLQIGCEPQSDLCARYVECVPHYEAELALPDENINRYRPDGVCWEGVDLAETCTTECREGLVDNQAELAIRNLPIADCAITAAEAGLDNDDGGTL